MSEGENMSGFDQEARRVYVGAVGRGVEEDYGVNGAEEFALRMESGEITAEEILHFSSAMREVPYDTFEVVIGGDVIEGGGKKVPFDHGDGVLYNFNLNTFRFE